MTALQVRPARGPQAHLLIAGCPRELSERLSRTIVDLGYRAFLWERADVIPAQIAREQFHVCICGGNLSPRQAQMLWNSQPESTQYLWVQDEFSAGTPPFPAEVLPDDLPLRDWSLTLRSAVTRATMQEQLHALEQRLQACLSRDLVCESPAMRELRRGIFQQSSRETPLILSGETGVAFSKTAWVAHQSGPRSRAPYLALNVTTLSADAFEQRLFAGEPTDPEEFDTPLLERLDGGTLFLDRIDTLARSTQKKLIRFLESPAIPRSDSLTLRYINLRLIVGTTATDKERSLSPLLRYLDERTDVAELKLPALRERNEDLRPLSERCLTEQSARLGILPPALDDGAYQTLTRHDWPGNDAELERVLTNLVQSHPQEPIDSDAIAQWLNDETSDLSSPGLTLAAMERQLIEATFARCAGNREKTAQMLDIGLRTLSGKLREYGYPPRGGPGSNVRRPKVATEPIDPQRRAA